MKTPARTSAVSLSAMFSLASAGVGENVVADTRADGCRGQLTDLVAYLKEIAAIEGVVFSVENVGNSTILYYPEFSQRLQCVDGILKIDFHDPKADLYGSSPDGSQLAPIRWVAGGSGWGQGAGLLHHESDTALRQKGRSGRSGFFELPPNTATSRLQISFTRGCDRLRARQ
jgi:hypothetical protein